MKLYKYLILLMGLGLFSCQKELNFDSPSVTDPGGSGDPSEGGRNIQGNWKFLYLDIDVKTITETSNAPSVSAVYKTQTIDNSGVITIDANVFKGTEFAYTVDTEIALEMQGVPFSKEPLKMVAPPYDFTSNYTKVSNDSLYFESGFIMNVPGTPVQNPAAGVKYELRGDSLILSVTDGLQQIVNQGGVSVDVMQDVKAKVILKRL